MARTYLTFSRHGTTPYFRRKVPDDLRQIIGKRYLIASLGSCLRRDAIIRARALAARTDALFDLIRRMSDAPNNVIQLLLKPESELTPAERIQIAEWEREQALGTDGAQQDALHDAQRTSGTPLLARLTFKRRQIERDEQHAQELADLAARHEAAQASDRELKQRARAKLKEQRAVIESHKSAAEALNGALAAFQALNASSGHPTQENAPKAPDEPSPRISEVWERYKAEKIAAGQVNGARGGWTNGEHAAKYHHWPHVRELISVIGDRPIATITKSDIRRFRDHVIARPNESATNKEKRVQRAGALFSWAVGEDLITDAFSDAFKLGFASEKNNYLKFTHADLKALFESETYREGKFTKVYDYWLPILGLYTGGRINELSQLQVTDVRTQDGIDVIAVIDDEIDKQLKTTGSRRIIPIHSKLIELGFLEFVQSARDSGQRRIFSELKAAKAKPNDYGRMPTQHFTNYRRSVGVGSLDGRSRKVFHSFRSTLISALRDAGVPQERRERIAGHESEGVNNENYDGGDQMHMFPIPMLKDDIESVRFPVEFTAYHPKKGQQSAAPCR